MMEKKKNLAKIREGKNTFMAMQKVEKSLILSVALNSSFDESIPFNDDDDDEIIRGCISENLNKI
jgi:hypothetical protein